MSDQRGPSSPFDAPPLALRTIVDAIVEHNTELVRGRRRRLGRHVSPSREALIEIVDSLRAALFPAHYGAADVSDEGMHYYVGATLDGALVALQEQIRRGLWVTGDPPPSEIGACERRAVELTLAFAERLPTIRELLGSDVRAAYEGDPAATSFDEVLFAYPGLIAITHYRIAHQLALLGVPLIPRIITEHAHSITGVDLHPGAAIGPHFFIDHGTGVVIGETSVIGARVRIYQGVTLGAKSFPLDSAGRPIKGVARHPIVEDEVVIYAGATILGRVTIGRGSSIGGNVWLTRSVPPGSRITQAQARLDQFEDGAGI